MPLRPFGIALAALLALLISLPAARVSTFTAPLPARADEVGAVWTHEVVRNAADLAAALAPDAADPSTSKLVRIDEPVPVAASYGFAPASLTVPRNQRITFANEGGSAHTVTGKFVLENGAARFADSGALFPDDAYTVVFFQHGTFIYHCALHHGMAGVITVS